MFKKFLIPVASSLIGLAISASALLAADYTPQVGVVDTAQTQASGGAACYTMTPLSPLPKVQAAQVSKPLFLPLISNGGSGPMCLGNPASFDTVIGFMGDNQLIVPGIDTGSPTLSATNMPYNIMASKLTANLVFTDSLAGGVLPQSVNGFTHYKIYRMDRDVKAAQEGDSPANLDEVNWSNRAQKFEEGLEDMSLPRIHVISSDRDLYMKPENGSLHFSARQICPHLPEEIVIDVKSVGVEKVGGHWTAWVFFQHTRRTTDIGCKIINAWQFVKLAEFWVDLKYMDPATAGKIDDEVAAATSIWPAAVWMTGPELAPILGSAKILPWVGRGVEYLYMTVAQFPQYFYVIELTR